MLPLFHSCFLQGNVFAESDVSIRQAYCYCVITGVSVGPSLYRRGTQSHGLGSDVLTKVVMVTAQLQAAW